MIQFPGGYKQDDPSFNFSVWGGMKEYPMPGPPVYTGGSGSGSGSASASASASNTSTAGPTESGDATQQAGDRTCSRRRRRRARHLSQ
jgi:hypothetical protein